MGEQQNMQRKTIFGIVAVTSLVAIGIALAVVFANRAKDDSPDAKKYDLDFPARLQWEGNFGYCGEVSFIQIGLKLGQYLSQYDARIAASGTTAQNLESSQLLIGDNDETAASHMHFKSESFSSDSSDSTKATKEFLVWIKKQILADIPVVIGVYTNEYLFYDDDDPTAGDSSYDHIVLVTGITTRYPDSDKYHADDVLHFDDHGLWSPDPNDIQYTFSYRFDEVQADREGANSQADGANVYSLPIESNYGIAIKGIKDANSDTIPVVVSTSKNYEHPNIPDGSATRPASMSMQITVQVLDMEPNTPYNLYWYDDLANVPEKNFNANAAQAFQSFTNIEVSEAGAVYERNEDIQSDQIIVFRAVLASAD